MLGKESKQGRGESKDKYVCSSSSLSRKADEDQLSIEISFY
jgi:hypothetical protein